MKSELKGFFTLVLLFFLILTYPLLGMLWHHDYPITSSEVLLILAGFFLLGVLLSALLQNVRPVVTNFVLVTLLMFAFLTQFNLLFVAMIAILISGIGLAFIFGKHFPSALLIVLLALISGAFLDSRMDRAGNQPIQGYAGNGASNRPLIHILVDGFIGPDGLPAPEESQNLRAEIMNFFEAHEFKVYTRAYTHYASTLDSMERALNFKNDNENIFQRVTTLREPMEIGRNAWFRALSDNGYPVVVYQSESVNFCESEPQSVSQCNVFPIPNLNTIHSDITPPGTRAIVLLRTLLRQSNILNDQLMRLTGQWGVANYDSRMLDRLVHDVQRMPGNAYFAHLLLPHQPMVFRPDCSLDYESDLWQRFAVFDGLIGNSEETQKTRYPRYTANAKCALSELGRVFKALKEIGLYDQSTIVVHGDHGGPLFRYAPFTQNANRLSLRDLREMFSTLFAVKYPDGQFMVDQRMISLNVLMARTLSEITGKSEEQLGITAVEEDEPFIYLSDTSPLTRVNINFFNE